MSIIVDENICRIKEAFCENVICIRATKGDGTGENPVYACNVYYTKDGRKIGEIIVTSCEKL